MSNQMNLQYRYQSADLYGQHIEMLFHLKNVVLEVYYILPANYEINVTMLQKVHDFRKTISDNTSKRTL